MCEIITALALKVAEPGVHACRRAGELQQQQHTLEQLEQQRLEAERNTRRYAQTLVQEKQKLGALEQELQAARQRIHDGEAQLNHLKGCAPRPPQSVSSVGVCLKSPCTVMCAAATGGPPCRWLVACLALEGPT